MKEQLISFETAKLAKENGFKIPVKQYYFEDGEFREHSLQGINGYYGEDYEFTLEEFDENWNNDWLTKKNGDRCFGCNKNKGYFETFSAPTQALLQKWLREVHNIHIAILPKQLPNNSIVYYSFKGKLKMDFDDLYETYEEALEHGLQEALKLIESK